MERRERGVSNLHSCCQRVPKDGYLSNCRLHWLDRNRSHLAWLAPDLDPTLIWRRVGLLPAEDIVRSRLHHDRVAELQIEGRVLEDLHRNGALLHINNVLVRTIAVGEILSPHSFRLVIDENLVSRDRLLVIVRCSPNDLHIARRKVYLGGDGQHGVGVSG